MRRGDILKKAIVGGDTESISGSTNMALRGISATAGGNARFRRRHIGTGVSPWADAWYFMDSGRIDVRASNSWTAATLGTFDIGVEKINPALNPTHRNPTRSLISGPTDCLAALCRK